MNTKKTDKEVNLESRQLFEISYQERQRLRKIVRKVHLKFLPDHLVNNKECDKLIESLSPMVREKLLKEYIEKVR